MWSVNITGNRSNSQDPGKDKQDGYAALRDAIEKIRGTGQTVTTSPDLGTSADKPPEGDTGANKGPNNPTGQDTPPRTPTGQSTPPRNTQSRSP